MRKFQYFDPTTIDEAVAILSSFNGTARIIAGGTDLLGQLKNSIQASYPEAVVNVKNIPQLTGIAQTEEGIKIGALTTVKTVSQSRIIADRYTALFQAAQATASPLLRTMGTIGGNICQNIRCWYYRAPKNYFPCLRKAGAPPKAICYAVKGDNRYHAIFGPVNRCFAVHPSDLAPALMVLQASLKTSKRTISINDFFAVGHDQTTILEPDEVLQEIQLGPADTDSKSAFYKFSLRRSIDFPVVNCAVSLTFNDRKVSSAIVCLNAVYNLPYRAAAAEQYLAGRELTEATASEAAEAAVSGARPLPQNRYMVLIAKDLIKKALLACT